MRKHQSDSGQSIAWAIAFVCLLGLIFLGSCIWKAVMFVKNSTFDGKHQFNVQVDGKQGEILSFNPDTQTLIELDITNVSDTQLGKALAVPIDGHIRTSESDIQQLLFQTLVHGKSSLTPLDNLRLWWFGRFLSSDAISDTSISFSDASLAKKIPKLFLDKTLYAEEKTIAIVNATGMSGYGNRLAKLFTNIGGNVVMVNTAGTLLDHSRIEYSGDRGYTVERIEKILRIHAMPASISPAIADITITIGKDLEENDIF